jgi:hypothetical protein
MHNANKAITRERHILPTIDELIHDLNGSTVYSKLHLRSGYHQLELDPSSRYITTFSMHSGLFRYKRLNFGISSASRVIALFALRISTQSRISSELFLGVVTIGDTLGVGIPSILSMISCSKSLFSSLSTLLRR